MKRKDADEDPEYARYRRKYPKPPSVETCVDLLGRMNVQGSYLESVLQDLSTHANNDIASVMAAFKAQTDDRARSIVLSVIADAASVESLPLLIETLFDRDEMVQYWAASGLHRLNTPEARRALWHAGTVELGDSAKTERFRQMLESLKRE
ncbi:MAG: HEAT repeat domain-containing protein [Myxococcota bacterium]